MPPLLAARPKPLQPKAQQIPGHCATAPALQYVVKPERSLECSRPVGARGFTVRCHSPNAFLAPQLGTLLVRIVFRCGLLGTQSSVYSELVRWKVARVIYGRRLSPLHGCSAAVDILRLDFQTSAFLRPSSSLLIISLRAQVSRSIFLVVVSEGQRRSSQHVVIIYPLLNYRAFSGEVQFSGVESPRLQAETGDLMNWSCGSSCMLKLL